MEYSELLDYIDLFREKAEKGKLVIFVGAGVSCNVEGMPSWNDLIIQMAKAIGYSRCTSCKHKTADCENTCHLKYDFSTEDFLKIPQYVFNYDRTLYNQVLSKSITSTIVDAPLSSAIFNINPVHIITTNYDQLLESSKHIFREQYEVIVHDKDLLTTDKSKYIIKMHGDMSDPESMVLKEQDYLNYSHNHVLIEHFIKSLVADHIVLFLGYSLNDYDIKLILSWLNYMRSQNGALDENQRVGYLIQDQETVDLIQQAYFTSNNVELINIHSMPLVPVIPKSLTNELGKRLYSFLQVIADPALEKNLSSIKKAIHFMCQFNFVNYEQILNFLHVKNYKIQGTNLRLFSEHNYTRLVDFMNSKEKEADQLKQLFLNAGIEGILGVKDQKTNFYSLTQFSQNSLFQDKLFSLYLTNQYDKLQIALQAIQEKKDPLDFNQWVFYQSLLHGYDHILKQQPEIDVSLLKLDQKVAYLYNTAVLAQQRSFTFDFTQGRQFIDNLSSRKEREMFSGYLDLDSGNSKERLAMHKALQVLKENMSHHKVYLEMRMVYEKIYTLKQIALTQYFFYYNNYALYQGVKGVKSFFHPYIEAILCANSDAAEKPSYVLGDLLLPNQKYPVDYLDIDILSKFIAPKDLSTLIKTYNVSRLNIGVQEVTFLTDCFHNICQSIVKAHTFGFKKSSFSLLSNLIILLNLVDLDEENQKKIVIAIQQLIKSKEIITKFFSIDWPDFRQSLKELAKLCRNLPFERDWDVLEQIITIVSRKHFLEYANKVNFESLRHLLGYFLTKDEETTYRIEKIVDQTEKFQDKVTLLRLFYPYISMEETQTKYKDFLSNHFALLEPEAIYDFVFSGWLALEEHSISQFLSEILKMSKKEGMGYSFEQVETKLDCVYLLYLNQKIEDIHVLKELAPGRPHLQFLLDPDHFDYSQVDFSNYMWKNFAHHPQYMEAFVAHRDQLIPKIQNRIEMDEASETEKKILYGFLLPKEEIWA